MVMMMMMNDMEIMDEGNEGMVHETVLLLVLPFLSVKDLAHVSETSKFFLQHILQCHDLWKVTFQNIDRKIARPKPLLANADLSRAWYNEERDIMRIPPRIHGHHDKYDWYRPNPRDIPVRRHPTKPLQYYLESGVYSIWRLNEDGDLIDQMASNWYWSNKIEFPRQFPVWCHDCKISLRNTPELISHCSQNSHIFNGCLELLDPRLFVGFEEHSVHNKAKAIAEFPNKVRSFIRELTTEPKNTQQMATIAEDTKGAFKMIREEECFDIFGIDGIYNYSIDFSSCNVEQVTEYCIHWLVDKVLSGDMCIPLRVAHTGWNAGDHCTMEGIVSSNLIYHLCTNLHDGSFSNNDFANLLPFN